MNMQEQGVQCSEQAPLQGNEVGWGLSLRQELEWVFLGGENAKKAGVERSGRQVKPPAPGNHNFSPSQSASIAARNNHITGRDDSPTRRPCFARSGSLIPPHRMWFFFQKEFLVSAVGPLTSTLLAEPVSANTAWLCVASTRPGLLRQRSKSLALDIIPRDSGQVKKVVL
jgi:hypothetical protein